MGTSKTRKYTSTEVRDKRSIVRTLNTFSKQYKLICCDSMNIDLNIEPMIFFYMDDESEHYENIIYAEDLAFIELKDTELILEVIDNLVSINRKEELKESLKNFIEEFDSNGKNKFFKKNDNETEIFYSEGIIQTKAFAKRVYVQIKNRIKFSRAQIYNSKDTASSVKNRMVYPIPTNTLEILIKKLEYIKNELDLFSEEKMKKIDTMKINIINLSDVKQKMAREKSNINYQEGVMSPNNSSEFHPVDEQEFNDSGVDSSMTTSMLLQKTEGLYSKELYADYSKLERYKHLLEVYYAEIDEPMNFIASMLELLNNEDKIYSKILNIDDKLYDRYELLFEELENYKEEFCKILSKYGKDWQKDLASKSLSNKSSITKDEIIKAQNTLMELLYCERDGLKKVEDYMLEEIAYKYLPYSVEELLYICYFDSDTK